MILFRLLGCILYVPRLFPVALPFIALSYSAEYFVSIGSFVLLISIFALLHFLFLFVHLFSGIDYN